MASSPSGDPHDREIDGDADVVRQLPQRAKRKPGRSTLARIESGIQVIAPPTTDKSVNPWKIKRKSDGLADVVTTAALRSQVRV